MRKHTLLAAPLVLLFAGVPASASTMQIFSAGDLAANDSFDWGQLDEAAPQPTSVAVMSALTRNAVISNSVGFTRFSEGTPPWAGTFNLGDNVLTTMGATASTDIFTITFQQAVAGLGLQIQAVNPDAFSASLEVFSGMTSLGVFGVMGVNDYLPGTAPFLGARSDAIDITRAVFRVTSIPDGTGLGVNTLLTTDTPTAIPEPGTLALVGIGALALLLRRRQLR